MNIIGDTTEHGRPEDTLRQSEEPYGRLLEPALDTVIEHASGRSPYANAARALYHNPSRESPVKRTRRRVDPYRREGERSSVTSGRRGKRRAQARRNNYG